MPHIHVKDKRTGHEYPVSAHLFNAEHHQRTGKSAYDAHGDLVPVKYHTTVTRQAAKKTTARTPRPASGRQAETSSGHQAGSEKEND